MSQSIDERRGTHPADTLTGAERFAASQGEIGVSGLGVVPLVSDLGTYVVKLAQLSGVASPEAVVTASVGAKYWQIGVGEWVKDTGTGNTGWVQHTSIE